MIADTTAHQCFSGRHNIENSVRSIKVLKNGKYDNKIWHNTIGRLFLPRIGHTEASHMPDIAHLQWEYKDSTGFMIRDAEISDIFTCHGTDGYVEYDTGMGIVNLYFYYVVKL